LLKFNKECLKENSRNRKKFQNIFVQMDVPRNAEPFLIN
jgi:hypothetical protein